MQIAQQIGSPPELFAYPVALQWIEGDWRIVLPTAAENIDAVELDNLDGFTFWRTSDHQDQARDRCG
ncbi:hypothetical protein GS539_21420, partial [Rhodococcus hoagii]|nr:hypothetical protein [Prescottella equi]